MLSKFATSSVIFARRKFFENVAFSHVFLRKVSIANIAKQRINNSVTLFFGKYLLTTNIISSGVLLFIGDILQQEIEYHENKLEKRYDYARLARMFIVGLAVGPLHHYYYLWIAKKWPARTTKTVLWKILLDQIVMSPLCIVSFFYGMALLEWKSLDEANQEILDKFNEVYLVDWIVWPPTQFFNFYFLPVKYQVFYINTVTMFYNVFLSYMKHRELANQRAQKFVCMNSEV